MRNVSPARPGGSLGPEREAVGAGPHAAEPADEGGPGAGQGRDVEAVPGVVLAVLEVHEGGLGEVVVGELEVADLGRHDGLGAGGQGRVPDGERLVVVEVAELLLGGEGVASQLHGEHDVGLLDDLLAVQLEVGVVQQQRVVVGRGDVEVPAGVVGEAVVLRVDAEALVVGDVHVRRGVAPGGGLLGADVELAGLVA